jgi:hypothetical protein
MLDEWLNHQRSGQRGASSTYGDKVIEAALAWKVAYLLLLCTIVILLQSLLALMCQGYLSMPDYSTLCRRQKTLSVPLSRESTDKALHLVGNKLSARDFDQQAQEAYIRYAVLDKMTLLEMPDSYCVEGA